MDLRQIDRLRMSTRKRRGGGLTRISELVDAGFLPGLPEDPDGFPYVLGEDGKAEIQPRKPAAGRLASKEQKLLVQQVEIDCRGRALFRDAEQGHVRIDQQFVWLDRRK